MSTTLTSRPPRRHADLRYVDEHVELRGTRPVTRLDLGVDVHAVATVDRVAQRDPASHWYVNQRLEHQVRQLVADGVDRPVGPLSGTRGRQQLAERHPVLAEWWGTPDSGSDDAFVFDYMPRWREHVPSARALWPLQNPGARHLPFDTDAVLSADDWRVLSHVADAVGIRSRAAVLSAVVQAHFSTRERASWLSLGSGGTRPVLKAAAALELAGVETVTHLWDSDPESLTLAHEMARQLDLTDRLCARLANVLDVQRLRRAPERFDLVDVLGLFEYLPSELPDDAPAGRATASEFLEAVLGMVRPGGIAVLANMLDTHPQLDFVMRCIQWPHIHPRGLDELVALVRAAGVDDEQVTIHLPDDGVYAVATIEV